MKYFLWNKKKGVKFFLGNSDKILKWVFRQGEFGGFCLSDERFRGQTFMDNPPGI